MTHHPLHRTSTDSHSTVLVLGARGRLGLAATRAFAQAGWQVLAQVRPGAKGALGAALPAIPGVWWMPVAVNDTPALAAQAQGAQVVVHALNPVYTHKAWREQAPALMEAAIAITRQLRATLMLPGNVYNFGEGMPPVLGEDTPQAATGFKGRLRVQLEQRLQAATQAGDMRAVVLRAGDFFGSGTGTWLDQAIAKDLPRGRVTWPGPLDVATPWAYLPDLARTFVRVAQERDRLAAFECLHFAGHHVSGQQWLHSFSAIAAEQGWLPDAGALRVGRLPWPVLRLLGVVAPTFAALSAMRYLWTTPHALDNTRLRALIGDEPHTPFDQAVRHALADLGLLAAPTPRAALA
ncbi:MAG: NAD-dependent epimerase/dehydratase family protein [Gammaproteobacteria bacterium]|jgi:nucleoside-diphosphate-sugar epimerase|nr:NAD-dependent epimerase/dehydratase family protein [Gammaproteobacteria bacterium]MBU0827206.1 NAD-dependent epimerase/dehydratase family protein [Gammaproteobacteria bacterium]MBU0893141.1 NAD-dependent epimerase/dehydratase family protein [Gammaproteobacteria bacterium]MBU1354703.1 NAD-dependent epimerase/dehydratase family protein [Gammaproteobacteria bacterium]MBU1506566.1 NAD-dependent epimerase/dehydratase family protein [Gammaproteobacteria bacterium]